MRGENKVDRVISRDSGDAGGPRPGVLVPGYTGWFCEQQRQGQETILMEQKLKREEGLVHGLAQGALVILKKFEELCWGTEF